MFAGITGITHSKQEENDYNAKEQKSSANSKVFLIIVSSVSILIIP
jgi:hypothetical protein